jgi:hypothetical protein
MFNAASRTVSVKVKHRKEEKEGKGNKKRGEH